MEDKSSPASFATSQNSIAELQEIETPIDVEHRKKEDLFKRRNAGVEVTLKRPPPVAIGRPVGLSRFGISHQKRKSELTLQTLKSIEEENKQDENVQDTNQSCDEEDEEEYSENEESGASESDEEDEEEETDEEEEEEDVEGTNNDTYSTEEEESSTEGASSDDEESKATEEDESDVEDSLDFKKSEILQPNLQIRDSLSSQSALQDRTKVKEIGVSSPVLRGANARIPNA